MRFRRNKYVPFLVVSSCRACGAPADDDEQDQLDTCNIEPLLTEPLRTTSSKMVKEIC